MERRAPPPPSTRRKYAPPILREISVAIFTRTFLSRANTLDDGRIGNASFFKLSDRLAQLLIIVDSATNHFDRSPSIPPCHSLAFPRIRTEVYAHGPLGQRETRAERDDTSYLGLRGERSLAKPRERDGAYVETGIITKNRNNNLSCV